VTKSEIILAYMDAHHNAKHPRHKDAIVTAEPDGWYSINVKPGRYRLSCLRWFTGSLLEADREINAIEHRRET